MPYQNFASFYDSLTSNVDYEAMATKIHQIITNNKDKCELVLDLACGTGSLSAQLSKLGYDVIGVDASAEMLMQASLKNCDLDKPVLYLCQPMERLDLFGTIDVAVCTLDSINHILDDKILKESFRRVSLFLEKNGLFIFDCNTQYKHCEVLGDNAFIYENDDVICMWQNTLQEDNLTVQIDLDFFSPAGKGLYRRSTECFCERAYTEAELAQMLTEVGLKLILITDEDGSSPRSDSQRLQYIAIKE